MKAAYIIQASDAGTRLDHFLVAQLPEYSRSKIQKTIKAGGAIINEKPVIAPHHFIKEGDAVSISIIAKSEATKQSPSQEITASPMAPRDDIKIIDEAEDYVVIEKPSGLLVHPTEQDEKDTLAHWVSQNYPECDMVGDQPELRPGIVHRLDKDASGLMVIARTQEMFDHLKEQFKERAIYKEYTALAHGVMQDDLGSIDFPIARSKNNARMAARPESQDGKPAHTDFEVLSRYANATLLKILPKTGRTHQIRVHFFALDHALVGDKIYNHRRQSKKLDAGSNRLFLHSTKLAFADLLGNKMEFESKLPKQLSDFITTLC